MPADAAFSRHEYQGGAQGTTITDNPLLVGANTINLALATNWPTGGVGPFTVTLEPGTLNEEQCQCTGRSGTQLTGVFRGFNGTTAIQHASGVPIIHGSGARDFDEANQAVVAVLGGIAGKGSIAIGTAAKTLGVFAPPTNGYPIVADSTQTTGYRGGWAAPTTPTYTPTWTQVGAITKTVNNAQHLAMGKLVSWQVKMTSTGTGTAATAFSVGLPVANQAVACAVGEGYFYDSSTTTTYNGVFLAGSGASTAIFVPDGASIAGWGVLPNLAVASGDILEVVNSLYWSA